MKETPKTCRNCPALDLCQMLHECVFHKSRLRVFVQPLTGSQLQQIISRLDIMQQTEQDSVRFYLDLIPTLKRG